MKNPQSLTFFQMEGAMEPAAIGKEGGERAGTEEQLGDERQDVGQSDWIVDTERQE